MDSDLGKKRHSTILSTLLCLAHVLPLAAKSENIMRRISEWSRSFHLEWTSYGWNDVIIQPARDELLDYCEKCAPITPPTLLVLKLIQPNPIYSLNQRYAEPAVLQEYIRLKNQS